MKIRMLLSGFLITLFIALPSVSEIRYPTPEDLVKDIYNYSYPAGKHIIRYMIIRGQNLDYLASIQLEQYQNLEAVVIEFTEDPAAADAIKEKQIAVVEKMLPHLVNLRKCRSLKYLVLHTGECLFIRNADGFACKSSDPGTRSKADRLNLERLNIRFGKKLEELLPGITVYAHTWGW